MEQLQPGLGPQRGSTQSGGTTRRSLMTGALAATTVGAVASRLPAAAAQGGSRRGYSLPRGAYRIDLDSHFIPPAYRAHLERHGVLTREWSAETHLAFMDAWGIQKSVVAAPQPFDFGDRAETRAVARGVNEAGRALLDDHGDRFAVHAILPLPDVDASIAELRYAFDTLGLDGGVIIFAHYDGTYLGDPAYESLYAELDRRRLTVWLHPGFPVEEPVGPFLGPILEYPFESTRAATNIIYNGVLERFPNIRWQLSHAGGTLPYILYRLAFYEGLGRPPLDLPTTPAGPFDAARKFLYTTALGGSDEQLLSLDSLTGPARIVFGTDFPFTDWFYAPDARRRAPWLGDLLPRNGDPLPSLSRLFSRRDRLRIERQNALKLYPGLVRTR